MVFQQQDPGPQGDLIRCTKCDEWKHFDEFARNKNNVKRLQRQYWCRVCFLKPDRKQYRISKPGDTEKQCWGCDRFLSLDRFTLNSERSDLLDSKCKDCQSDAHILRTFGITRTIFNDLLAIQGDRCATCPRTEPSGNGNWHVDHDHSCCPGKKSCGACIRGLLCYSCNAALGFIGDNRTTLLALADYVSTGGVGSHVGHVHSPVGLSRPIGGTSPVFV